MKPGRAGQLVRHLMQAGTLLFIVYAAAGTTWRNYKLAHNSERLVALIHGDEWGWLYGLNDRFLGFFGRSYDVSLDTLGMPWAARIGGLNSVDPIMALAHIVSTRSFAATVWTGALLPLVLAALLGKVFCSHICPMRTLFKLNALARKKLAQLDIPLLDYQTDVRLGGWVLIGGLLATLSIGAGVWLLILPYVGLAASLFVLMTTSAVGGLLVPVVGWLVVDMFVAPGLWCRTLCPTGWLLENVGRLAPWRLRKVDPSPCLDSCTLCVQACPYSLAPRVQTHAPMCDSCGACTVVCPSQKLRRTVAIKRKVTLGGMAMRVGLLLLAAAAITLISPPVFAHHNKGLPHYGYYENYPQVPTEEYVEIHKRWEIGATIFNFQGYQRGRSNTPDDVKIFAYLYDLKADKAWLGKVRWEIRDGDKTVSVFERERVDEEAVYSTRETLPHSGTYELVAHVDGEHVPLAFFVELNDNIIPWGLIAGIGGPLLVLVGLGWFGRRRKRRRRRKTAVQASGSAGPTEPAAPTEPAGPTNMTEAGSHG